MKQKIFGKTGIQGLDTVVSNLNKEISRMKRASLKGLLKAAAMIRVDMDKTPPLIPVDTGYLRSSWTVYALNPMVGLVVRMGFAAYYAWYVHEMVGANFKRPGAGAKFFEAALKRNYHKILKMVHKEARVR